MKMSAEKQYQDIINHLEFLSETQLLAVHTIVISMTQHEDDFMSPLHIKSEEQLWAHIDHSIAQADAGKGEDADAVIDELMQEFAV